MILDLNAKKSGSEYIKVTDVNVKNMSVYDVIVDQKKEIVNGRIVKTSVKVETDVRDNFKDYKVSDFYMENLEAAGAVPTKTVQYYDGDIDRVLSQFDGQVEVENNKNIEG